MADAQRARRKRGRPYKFQEGLWAAASRRLKREVKGVLLVCPEPQAMEVLLHFGEPAERRPHALLAVPCALARPQTLRGAVQQAIEPSTWSLAHSCSPSAELRAELLRSALEALGCDLWSLEQHCCLASLHMPYSLKELEDSLNDDERDWRELCTQLELMSSAYGTGPTACLLREQLRLEVDTQLASQEAQLAVRRKLGVSIPLHCKDAFKADVQVLILPEDVTLTKMGDVLRLSAAAPEPPKEGWFCFTSRKTGQLYYWNQSTNSSTTEAPWLPAGLPVGWTCEVDSTSGRLIFRHPEHCESHRMP